MKKSKNIPQRSNVLNQILFIIPVLINLYALFLFLTTSREIGLEAWRPVKYTAIEIFLIILLLSETFKTKNKNLMVSIKLWFMGLLLSIFSWAIGGFIFDLIRVFQIISEKINQG